MIRLVLMFFLATCLLAQVTQIPGAASSASGSSVVRNAALYSGADCGAKVNAASVDLGATAGEIVADESCGVFSTAVSLPANHVLQIIGAHSASASITAAHIQGSGFGGAHIAGAPPTKITQASGSNLSCVVCLSFDGGSLRDLEIDANKANNASATDAILVTARGVLIENVYVHAAKRDNIRSVSSTTTSNTAAITRLSRVTSTGADGDGFHCKDATDSVIENMSEFESNGSNGVELENCGAARIDHNDFAGNTSYGLYAYGTSTGLQSNFLIITANQFGGGFSHDIYIDGYNAAYVSVGNNITGNVFYGGGNRTSNTFDAILLEDTFDNVVSSNVVTSPAGHTYRYGINYVDGGFTGTDVWAANTFNGTYGTGQLNYKANFTRPCLNTGVADCHIAGQLAIGNNFLVGGYPGQANKPLFQPNTGASIGQCTGTLIGLAESGVAYNLQVGTDGCFGVRRYVAAPAHKVSGTKFTASGCSNTTTVGGATAGSFASGTTGACTVTITMGDSVAAANGWACGVSNQTTANLVRQTASTTTTATVSGTTTSGDVIVFNCIGY